MFNLEKSITEWRQRMLAAGIKTPTPLEELEHHLRDEIERQMRSGGSTAAAFTAAVQIIGPAVAIRDEFQIVEATEGERKWKEGLIWSGAILGLLQLGLIGAVLFNSEMSFGQRMSGLGAIATSLVLAGGLAMDHRFPVIREKKRRLMISCLFGGIPAIAGSVILARVLLVNQESPFGQWLASMLWVQLPPTAVAWGVIMGFEMAARRKSELVAAEALVSP